MPANPPVTVIGAGLVGSLASLFLAKRGHSVEIYERRPDMRLETVDRGRSINLAISARGLHALAQVGLEQEALAHAIPMYGRAIHPLNGPVTIQAYGKDRSQHINSISRAWLNQMLMTRAEQTGKVKILFRHRLEGIDLETGTLSLLDESTKQTRAVKAAMPVLGTDGSGSALRAELVKRGLSKATSETLAHGYKELTIPAGPGGSYQMEKNALHIWPRGSFMLIALPNEDGSFTLTLFLPFEGEVSFAALDTPARLHAFFEAHFPDARALIPTLEQDFFGNPTGSMVTVKCAPWNAGGKALLMGDAAHAIVPFFGQGMNCGFEDCTFLDGLLDQGKDWSEVFETVSRERKAHADAIADMAVENFVEMRDRTGDPRFLFEKAVEKQLLNAFPGEFVSRYTLVSFSLVPYRYAYEVGELSGKIIAELSKGLARPEDVDLERAGKLIREQLVPYRKARGF